ncbi:MAG: hypothetical protein OHK0038_28170 [Flammeovirgaceae bacterium]
MISSSVQDFSLSSGIWLHINPSAIAITNPSVAFIKFTVINPNTFPIFIDNWSIEEKGKVILQENHYDPYGFELYGIDKKGYLEHDYQYNGKEHLTDFGLEWDDYGARTRDRQLHIWGQVDPLAEAMPNFSPYSYSFNSPMRFSDPSGMYPEDESFEDWVKRQEAEDKAFNAGASLTEIYGYQARSKRGGGKQKNNTKIEFVVNKKGNGIKGIVIEDEVLAVATMLASAKKSGKEVASYIIQDGDFTAYYIQNFANNEPRYSKNHSLNESGKIKLNGRWYQVIGQVHTHTTAGEKFEGPSIPDAQIADLIPIGDVYTIGDNEVSVTNGTASYNYQNRHHIKRDNQDYPINNPFKIGNTADLLNRKSDFSIINIIKKRMGNE